MNLKEYLKEDGVKDFKKEALKELTKLGVKYKDGSVWIPIELIKNERVMNRIKYLVKKLVIKKIGDVIDK